MPGGGSIADTGPTGKPWRIVVSSSKRLIGLVVAVSAIGGAYAPSGAGVAQDGFHITFGTTGDPSGRNADSAAFLVETVSGDIVVAGNGASFSSDDGRRSSNPMVARTNTRGELRWQRVYADLANQSIIAFASHGEEQYLVLERLQPWPLDNVNTVTLRRIDERGAASEALLTLDGFRALDARPVFHAELSHFLIAGTGSAGLQILHVDLQGHVTESSLVRGLERIQQVQAFGEQDFLVSRSLQAHEHVVNGRPVLDMHTDLIRLKSTGEAELLLRLTDRLCRHAVASLDRVVCVEVPLLRTDQTNDAIVAYSVDGSESWRRALERSVYVEHMKLLDSGDLLYAYHEEENVAVSRVSSSGNQVWKRTLRSAGQYTFLSAIEVLRDGRLALVGATGPWNGFTSMDTDAMVIVTGISEPDLGQETPEVVSHIVELQ